MRELEQFLNVEAEWVFDRLSECGFDKGNGADRAYYQGRIDQLAQVRRFLGQPQIMKEKESEQTLCGDCLRPNCYHLEQVRGRV